MQRPFFISLFYLLALNYIQLVVGSGRSRHTTRDSTTRRQFPEGPDAYQGNGHIINDIRDVLLASLRGRFVTVKNPIFRPYISYLILYKSTVQSRPRSGYFSYPRNRQPRIFSIWQKSLCVQWQRSDIDSSWSVVGSGTGYCRWSSQPKQWNRSSRRGFCRLCGAAWVIYKPFAQAVLGGRCSRSVELPAERGTPDLRRSNIVSYNQAAVPVTFFFFFN